VILATKLLTKPKSIFSFINEYEVKYKTMGQLRIKIKMKKKVQKINKKLKEMSK